MKTVYAFIKYQGNSLAVDFPLNICDMFDHLGSIGIRVSPSNVTIADTNDVAVRLTGLNEVGTAIIGKLSSSDSLVDINMLCHSIDEACRFVYEDMAERLSASDARSAKELMQVVEEFNRLQQTQKIGRDIDKNKNLLLSSDVLKPQL